MKNIFISFIFLFFFISNLCSQNTHIEGFIKDEKGNPIPGISVYLKKTKTGTSSNASGFYSLQYLSKGDFTLVYTGIGFETIEQKLSIKNADKITLDQVLIERISELNEVVISGGQNGIKNIPGSVQYLDKKELSAFSYTDINRALKNVPGVNMQEEDGFGLRPNIGLRATGVERSSKITLMEDGILIAPAPYIAPAAYYFPTMGRMQGIEVMKGHSQIKYGPYTTGGALNLISTQIPDQFSGNLNLMYGSFGTYNMHAVLGNSHENISYVIEAFQYGSNGFKEIDGGGFAGFRKNDFSGKIRYSTDESAKVYQSLTLKLGYTDEDSKETYLGLSQADFDSDPYRRYMSSEKDHMMNRHRQISMTHLVRFNKHFSITSTLYYNDFRRNWYKLDKVRDTSGNNISISSILDNPAEYKRAFALLTGISSNENEALLVKANNRSYYSEGLQSTAKYRIETEKVDHKMELGIRIHKDQVDRFQWIDEYGIQSGQMILNKEGVPGTESNRIEWANAMASYFQYEMRIGKISISPGLRFEHIELNKFDYGKNDVERTAKDLKESQNTVNVLLPGIGLDYKFNFYNSIFAGYHKGFAPPGTKEGTKPEESENFELGYRHNKNSLSINSVLFYNYYKNLLGSDLNASGGAGSNDLFNGGKARSYGFEFQAKYNLLQSSNTHKLKIPAILTYTYTDAIFLSSFESEFEGWGDVEKGDQLPYQANNQLALTLGFEWNKIGFNLSGRYMDAMRTEPGQEKINPLKSTDAYIVFDASFNLLITKGISFFSSINNISDEVYIVARRPAGLRPGLPRSINIGLKGFF